MNNIQIIKTSYFCAFLLILFNSCSGGGTLGSSGGGVTIKGSAKSNNTGEAIANSPMTVLNSENLTTVLSSETNENGEFTMNLTDVDDSILLDIEKTTNSVKVDKSLLKMDELKTIILDRESISTDIELYLGVDLEIRGACNIQKVNSDIFIQLESEKDDCTVNLRSLFGGNTKTDSASIYLCDKLIANIRNSLSSDIDISSKLLTCDNATLQIKLDNISIQFKVL